MKKSPPRAGFVKVADMPPGPGPWRLYCFDGELYAAGNEGVYRLEMEGGAKWVLVRP